MNDKMQKEEQTHYFHDDPNAYMKKKSNKSKTKVKCGRNKRHSLSI